VQCVGSSTSSTPATKISRRTSAPHITVIELLASTPLHVERLSETAQCSQGEAFEVLETLAVDGVVERLLDGSRSFRLTPSARQSLQSRIKYSQRQSLDQRWDLISAYLDVDSTIGRCTSSMPPSARMATRSRSCSPARAARRDPRGAADADRQGADRARRRAERPFAPRARRRARHHPQGDRRRRGASPPQARGRRRVTPLRCAGRAPWSSHA
jgi:hypothetical protein